jgi:hypothetical protein
MQGLIELDLVQHVSDRQRRRRVLMWERFWAQKKRQNFHGEFARDCMAATVPAQVSEQTF